VRLLASLSPRVHIKQVDERLWLEPFHKFRVSQRRPKLMHAYGTTQVFNPKHVGQYKRLIFLDVDTFLIRNIDELFCSVGFAASKRRGVGLFNGGVFTFEPSSHLYQLIEQNMLKYMEEPGLKKFAMQTLLHRTFGESFFCLNVKYNCHGLCGSDQSCDMLSSKCGIKDEEQLFSVASVIHAKISAGGVMKHVPRLFRLWSSYGPS